jgi:hypothetical protein
MFAWRGAQSHAQRDDELSRRHLAEVPRTDRVHQGLDDRALADALPAAEAERVVDLLARPLHAVGEPRDDVVGIVGVDLVDVTAPRLDVVRV